MSCVFLDTVGVLATWDKRDQWHSAAVEALSEIQTSGAAVLTTSFVLLECGNAAARRPYRGAVERLREALEDAGNLVHPSDDDWTEAWLAYVRGDGNNAGIVDQVSFVTMRRLDIREAFTNDQHFSAAGFKTLF